MEQNIHIQKNSRHYLKYFTDFFKNYIDLKNSFYLLKQKRTPPQILSY